MVRERATRPEDRLRCPDGRGSPWARDIRIWTGATVDIEQEVLWETESDGH